MDAFKSAEDAFETYVGEPLADFSDEASGALGDLTGDSEILRTLLAFVTPFLVTGVKSMAARQSKFREARNPVRGMELLKDFHNWRRLNTIYIWLTGRQLIGTFFLLSYFLWCTWFLAGYLLFIPDDGAPPIGLQLERWNQAGDGLEKMVFLLAFCPLPLMLITAVKTLIDNAKLEICGSLVAKLEEHYGFMPKKLHSTIFKMSSRMWWFTVLVGPLAGLVILAHFIFNKTDPDGNRPLSFKGVMSYFLGHGVGWLIVFVVAISSITSGVTLVCTSADLLRHNIYAYTECLDVLCMQVNFVYGDALAKVDKNVSAQEQLAQTQMACATVKRDPLVIKLQQQLAKRERYISSVAKELLKGSLGTAVNTVYACTLAVYFFLLFFIAITYLKLTSGVAPITVADVIFPAMVIIGIVLSLFLAVQPLLPMCSQAKAWATLCKGLKSTDRKNVSTILSDSKDPEALLKHHEKLTERFTWKVLGLDMSYGAICAFVATYGAILWSAVVLPAMSNYVDSLKEQYFYNSTLGAFGENSSVA
jgi:hypothetical protein